MSPVARGDHALAYQLADASCSHEAIALSAKTNTQ